MENVVKKYIKQAKHCLLCQDYGKAYAFYLLAIKLCPQYKNELANDFSTAWHEWSIQLREIGRISGLFTLYEEGCEVFMENDMLHFHMGNALFHLGLKLEAIGMFRKALVANEHCHDALISLENACRGVVDSWHFAMLNDTHRNILFKHAIGSSIAAVDSVLDIGAGTGILSMFAIQHGAKIVYSCEMSPVMQSIARECIAANKMTGNITLLPCCSTDLSIEHSNVQDANKSTVIPERCSLMISETVDAGLFGEGIVETVSHAWQHLLIKPENGGRIIPYSANIHCALIECEEIFKKHSLTGKHNLPGVIITSGVRTQCKKSCLFKCKNFGFTESSNTCDMEPYSSERLKNLQHKVLSKTQKVISINFNDPEMMKKLLNEKIPDVSLEHCATVSGYADAIIIWFDLILDESESPSIVNTSVESDHCWDQAVYPIRQYDVKECLYSNDLPTVVFKRLLINKSEKIKSVFSIHSDCLVLNSFEVVDKNTTIDSNVPHDSKHSLLQISAREEQIFRMNDISFSNMCFRAVCHLNHSIKKTCNIFDISNEFDLIAIKLAQAGKGKIHKFCQTAAIKNALSKICQQCSIDITFLTKISLENKRQFDIVVSHVIEPSGLISPNAICNICQAKTYISSSGMVIPNRLSLICQLISSEELLSKCMILSEANTAGLKIAETMNDFRVSVHSDLDMHTFTYKELSKPETVLNYNFNNSENSILLNMQKSAVIKAINSGTVHAVLFWFKINVFDNDFIDTSEQSNHWKQAAYLFTPSKQLTITSEEEVVLKVISKNDSLLFLLSKYGY